MTSYHDAYLFKPDQFMLALQPHLEALARIDAGYAGLRAAAIALFDKSPQVRYLAATYGDWERERLLAGAPADRPQGFHDIAFWFVILLYGQLLSRPHALGLGGKWETLAARLQGLGWSAQDTGLLVRGHKFIELAQAQPGQTRLGYWHHLYPRAKDGYVGWLSLADVRRLRQMLIASASRVQAAGADLAGAQDEFQRGYRAAVQMVTAADEASTGLCVLLAG